MDQKKLQFFSLFLFFSFLSFLRELGGGRCGFIIRWLSFNTDLYIIYMYHTFTKYICIYASSLQCIGEGGKCLFGEV